MLVPPVPDNEAQRLKTLEDLGLLYTPAEERFDRITRLASRVLGTKTALVSLVARDVQWFKSAVGLDATETPREVSFCGHAILGEETFVVEDAANDPRFHDNPLVTADPSIRFYAGHPLHASDGSRVGTLCVIDKTPRAFTDAERRTLQDMAAFAEAELQRVQLNTTNSELMQQRDELQRKSTIDELTRCWNRGAIFERLSAEMARAARGTALSIAMIDIDRFKLVNDTHGHQAGDRVLAEVARRIRSAAREFDALGRYGGEEFLALLSGCTAELAPTVADRLRRGVEVEPVATEAGDLAVTISVGVATYGPGLEDAEVLLGAADRALYRAKQSGRNRVEVGGPE